MGQGEWSNGGLVGQFQNRFSGTDWRLCHSYVMCHSVSCKCSFSRNYRWVIMWQDYWHYSTNWLGEVFKKLFIWTFHHKSWVFIDSKVPRRNKGRWSFLCIALFEWVHPAPLWPKPFFSFSQSYQMFKVCARCCHHKSVIWHKTQETQLFGLL